jgi:di/tricarboxylate transporter
LIDITPPDAHGIAVLVLTLLALFLFTREKIPLETSSLFVLVALALGFTLFPYKTPDGGVSVSDFFHGFGHKALIAVAALMIVGQGLVRTGALEPVGRLLARLWRRMPMLSLLLTLLISAALSAFINNTPIVVLMLPLLIGVAVRNKASATGTLMPMGLASLVGGMTTTIGTSTNLLVVAVAEDMGVTPFQMFDFFVPAAIAGGVAIAYLWLIAPRMLPERQAPISDASSRRYTAQIVLNDNSPIVGQSLASAIEKTENSLRIERIQRNQGVFITPLPDVALKAGDRLTTTDTPDNLREFASQLDALLYAGEHLVDDEHPLTAQGQQLAEVAITAGSRLLGRKLTKARLQSRYGLRFLAFHRVGRIEKPQRGFLDKLALEVGDVLLVQADKAELQNVKAGGDFLVLDGSVDLPHTSKAPLAMGILIAVVAAAAAGIAPIAVTATAGCLLLIGTGCLSWRDATNALSAQVILIVVSSLALGLALMKTGGADYLAQLFLAATFGTPAWLVLSALILMMALMTNIVSNNAAAVIGTPIAVNIAAQLGMPVEPFVLAVLFGANLSFATPMAYKTNLLVMNAGGYKFGDFVRVGVPLMLIMWITLSIVLVTSYGLY